MDSTEPKMGSDMREVWFYRFALFAPGALHLLLGVVSDRLLGIVLFTLFYGGLPYAVFLLGALYWSRHKSAEQLRRWLLLAPVWYAATFAVIFIIVAAISGDVVKGDFIPIAKGIALMTGGALAYGYLWVLLTLGAWKLVGRTAGSMANPHSR
jgi:hypothetical protein